MEQENNNLNQNDDQNINKPKNEEINNEENHEDNINNEAVDNQEDNVDGNDNNIDNENTDVEETTVSDVDEETEIEEDNEINENDDNVSPKEQTDENANNEQADEDVDTDETAEEEPVVNQEGDTSEDETPASSKKYIILIIALVLILIGSAILTYFVLTGNREEKNPKTDPVEQKEDDVKEDIPKENKEENTNYLAYQIKGNSIGNFDLQFLKLENNNKNVIYSPLSIKYALEMLKEGTNGETKEQIERIIGNYTPKKYANNANMSFANAMFIRDTKRSMIKSDYIDNLTKNYNAAIVYDSFKNPNNINKWISEKTFKLINNIVKDVSETDYILTNALAIDMEWIKKIQPEDGPWSVSYIHEDYSKSIEGLGAFEEDNPGNGFKKLDFKDNQKVAAVEIGAVANRYDIVNVMGIDKVKDIVGTAYQKWLDEGAEGSCYELGVSDPSEKDPDRETFVNNYIDEINKNYNKLSSSTDYSFYVDDNIKIFSKDLKEYSGTTLQYIAIMPTRLDLATFIKSNNANDITTLISKLQPMEINSFKDGVISEITGYIPMFNFDYTLDLTNDLKKIGITNVFDLEKADLSNLTTEKSFISGALHQSTIEFSNSGIKAAAVSILGGAGAGECGFDYIFEIPKDRIQKIDLTFNRPFLFLIADKNTKEVWFTGSVYQPAEYDTYVKSIKSYNPWES